MKEKLETLDSQEKSDFKDGLKTYLGYQEEITDLKESQREQITIVAAKVKSLSKKEVRKLFNYFKKETTPEELREDAEAIEEVESIIK
jgi:hypothetical protein